MKKHVLVLTAALCTLLFTLFAEAAGKIPLRIEPAPAAVQGYPVSAGVPFARGVLKDIKNIRVLDANGKEVPCQVRELAPWDAGGGVKAALVTFLADVKKTAQTGFYSSKKEEESFYTLEYGGAAASARSAQPVKVTGAGTGTITVDTGALSFKVGEKAFSLGSFSLGGKQVASSVDLVLKAQGKEFRASKTKAAKATVEDAGPVVACIRLDGKHTAPDGSAYFDYVVRIFAYAGKPYVRVLYRIVNTDDKTGTESIEGWGWEMKVPGAAKYAFGGDKGKVHEGALGEAHIYQGGDVVGSLDFIHPKRMKKKGNFWYKGAAEGVKAAGWADVSGAGGVTAVVRNFHEQYPKVLDAKAGRLTLWLHAPKPWNDKAFGSTQKHDEPVKEGYAIGFAKTHELFFNFHAGDRKTAQSGELAAVFQEKPFVKAPPAQYCGSGAFGRLSPNALAKTDYPACLDTMTEHIRIIADRHSYFGYMDWTLYGNYNFGETQTLVAGSHFFEAPRCMLLLFLTRDTYGATNCTEVTEAEKAEAAKPNKSLKFMFDKAEAGSRHHMDIDVMHCNKAKGRFAGLGPGMHWASSLFCNNRDPVGRPVLHHLRASPEVMTHYHNWGGHPGGLYEFYLLSGDRFALETLKLQADFYIALYKSGFKEKHHESQHAWPLWTLCAAYEATGEKKYLDGCIATMKFLVEWWNKPEVFYNDGNKICDIDHPMAYWTIDDTTMTHVNRPCKHEPKCTGFRIPNAPALMTAVIRFRELNRYAKTEIKDEVLTKMLVESMRFIFHVVKKHSYGFGFAAGACGQKVGKRRASGCRGTNAIMQYPFLYAASLLPPGQERSDWLKRATYKGNPPFSKVAVAGKEFGYKHYRSAAYCRPNEMGPSTFLWNIPHYVALWEEMKKEGKLK